MEVNPSFFQGESGDENRPVEQVIWSDAMDFCQKLTNFERADGIIRPNELYRLPTEAEWELICRAESSTRFSFGDALSCGDLCEPSALGSVKSLVVWK